MEAKPTTASRKNNSTIIQRRIKEISGIAGKVPNDFDYKEELFKILKAKHLK